MEVLLSLDPLTQMELLDRLPEQAKKAAVAELPPALRQKYAAHEIKALSSPAALARHIEACKAQGMDVEALLAGMHEDKMEAWITTLPVEARKEARAARAAYIQASSPVSRPPAAPEDSPPLPKEARKKEPRAAKLQRKQAKLPEVPDGERQEVPALAEAPKGESWHHFSFIMGLAHCKGFGALESKSTGLAHLHDAATDGHGLARKHAKKHGPKKGGLSSVEVGKHLGGTDMLRPDHLEGDSSHLYCGTWDSSDEEA